MAESTVRDLIHASIYLPPIGRGTFSYAYALSDARFDPYLLKIYRSRLSSRLPDDTIKALNEHTALTPVAWDYFGRNFGQALLTTVDYSQPQKPRLHREHESHDIEFVVRQQGDPLERPYTDTIRTLGTQKSVLNYLQALSVISDSGWQGLLQDIHLLGLKGIGIDMNPEANNLLYTPERLNLIDIPTPATEGVFQPHFHNHANAIVDTFLRVYGDSMLHHSGLDNQQMYELSTLRKPLIQHIWDIARENHYTLDKKDAEIVYAGAPIKPMTAHHCSLGSIVKLSDTPEHLLESLNDVKDATIKR